MVTAFSSIGLLLFVHLNSPTLDAFEKYIGLTEERFHQSIHSNSFLYLDSRPDLMTKARAGEILIEGRTTQDNGQKIKVPEGLIQDWFGMAFIPGATIPQVRAVLQDYVHYKEIYKPEVIEARLNKRDGDEFDIFLRLYKKQI